MDDWTAVRLRSIEAALVVIVSNIELKKASSLEGTSNMGEVGVISRLTDVIEATSVLIGSSGTGDVTRVESKALTSVAIAGSSISEDMRLSPLAMVVKL